MVLISLSLLVSLVVVEFIAGQNFLAAEDLKTSFFNEGILYCDAQVEVKMPEKIPVGEKRAINKSGSKKIKYRWINDTVVIYFYPPRFLKKT